MRKLISILLTIAILCSIAAAVFFLFLSSKTTEVQEKVEDKMAAVRAAKAAKKYQSEIGTDKENENV